MLITKLLRFPLTSIKLFKVNGNWNCLVISFLHKIFFCVPQKKLEWQFSFLGLYYLFKQQYIFTKLHNIYVLSHKYVFCSASNSGTINKASLKLLLSFYDCDHICNEHGADKVPESVSGVEMDAYATQLCSPSHSHTVVLSFSRFLFYVRQERPHRKLWHLCLQHPLWRNSNESMCASGTFLRRRFHS